MNSPSPVIGTLSDDAWHIGADDRVPGRHCPPAARRHSAGVTSESDAAIKPI